jgi:hypothetical protein
MIQTKSSVTEGFVGSPDDDMALGKPKYDDTFEDLPASTSAPAVPSMNMNSTMGMNSTMTRPTTRPTSAPAVAGMARATPTPTSMAVAAEFPSDVEGYKSTIKKLEEDLNECKATNLTLRTNMSGADSETPLPTMGTNMQTQGGRPETFEDVEEDEYEEQTISDFFDSVKSITDPKEFIQWAKDTVAKFPDAPQEHVDMFKELCNAHYKSIM